MSTCQKELSDFSAEKQIFDLASLLQYLSAAANNLCISHLVFLWPVLYMDVWRCTLMSIVQ